MYKHLSKQFYKNCLNHFINKSETAIDKCWYLLMKKTENGSKSHLYIFFLYLMLYKEGKKVNKTARKCLPTEYSSNIGTKKNLLYLRDKEEAENLLIAWFFNSDILKKELSEFIKNIGDESFDITDDVEELLENLLENFQCFSQDPEKLVH